MFFITLMAYLPKIIEYQIVFFKVQNTILGSQ